ncbi:MAG: hypothetical protein ACJA16_004375, partial [Akkermansiaceae bacterium]
GRPETPDEMKHEYRIQIKESRGDRHAVICRVAPLSPPSAPVQGRLQSPPAKRKLLAVLSHELPVHCQDFNVTGRQDGEALFGQAFPLGGI